MENKRIIKFRAYKLKDSLGEYGYKKGMYHWLDMQEDKNYWLDDGYWGVDFIPMQYTGLKDKNGREIYEGDIVNEFRESRSFPEGRKLTHEIKWSDDMTLDDSYGMTVAGFCMFGGELEIIGNIYENPELINYGN